MCLFTNDLTIFKMLKTITLYEISVLNQFDTAFDNSINLKSRFVYLSKVLKINQVVVVVVDCAI